jgi:anaerobic ribonucleoside-triphosphate reductase activating protein
MELRVAMVVEDTGAEGPGRRLALWVQGCTIHCPGCCNPQMFAAEGGTAWDVAALAAKAIATPGLEGISVLGGEPFEQPAALAALAQQVRAAGLSVMIFTGYTLDELRARHDTATDAALAQTDILVDGRFEEALYETTRRWIGSSNQRLHFLSDRYDAGDPRFREPNAVEVRVKDGEIVVTGWPTVGRDLVKLARKGPSQ